MPFFDIFASPRWSVLRMRTKVVSIFIIFKTFYFKKLRPKMTKRASRGFCLKRPFAKWGHAVYQNTLHDHSWIKLYVNIHQVDWFGRSLNRLWGCSTHGFKAYVGVLVHSLVCVVKWLLKVQISRNNMVHLATSCPLMHNLVHSVLFSHLGFQSCSRFLCVNCTRENLLKCASKPACIIILVSFQSVQMVFFCFVWKFILHCGNHF